MKNQNKLLIYYFLVLVGICFLLIGFICAINLNNVISELEVEYQWRIYVYMILAILFILNGLRILSRFYKDKIKGK